MPLYARKATLLAKTETVYGTDSIPVGATNAIETSDLKLTPLAGATVNRGLDRATLGNDLEIQVETYAMLEFNVDIAGSTALGVAPPWGTVLMSCGFGQTVVASTSVTYAPVSTAYESMTLYFGIDGQQHKLRGARGNCSMALSPGGIPRFKFTFTGLYTAPASVADPVMTLTAFRIPTPVNNLNMTGLSLHGGAVTMTQMDIDIGNEIKYRNVVGAESVELIDRKTAGSITFEAPAISVKNWFELARTSTLGAFTVTQGTVATNKVVIASPQVQIISPTYTESDGIATIQAKMSFVPSGAGNNEISIQVI